MANPEHVEMLVNSTKDQWNAWRKTDRDLQPDLSGVKFAEILLGKTDRDERLLVDLSGIDLSRAKLQDADFTAINIDDADLRFADLSDATFRLTSADRAKFNHAEMHRFKVISAGHQADESAQSSGGPAPVMTILNVSLVATELQLRGASLRDANLTGANLSGANLGAADLTGATLRVSNVQDANLSATNLIRTDLESTRIWHARLFPRVDEQTLIRLFLLSHRVINIGTMMSEVNRLIWDEQGMDVLQGRHLYFRGEKKSQYELKPSVMRNTGHTNAEDVMLTDLSLKRPEEIDERQLYFQRLVMARHFELPTRLLDVTRNPLVAMYYASEETDDENDGVVHVFLVDAQSVKPYDSDTVSLISNFVRLKGWEKSVLLSYHVLKPSPSGDAHMVEAFEGAYPAALTRLNHFVAQEKPYWEPRIDLRDLFRVFFVEPQEQFARLRSHSGAFMMSAFHPRFERFEVDRWFSGACRYQHMRLTVPHGAKRQIRDELRMSDITEERLKADLQSAAEAVERFHRSPD